MKSMERKVSHDQVDEDNIFESDLHLGSSNVVSPFYHIVLAL